MSLKFGVLHSCYRLCNIKVAIKLLCLVENKELKSVWFNLSYIHPLVAFLNPFMYLSELCLRMLLVVSLNVLLDLKYLVSIQNDKSEKKKLKIWKFSRYPTDVVTNIYAFNLKDKKVI